MISRRGVLIGGACAASFGLGAVSYREGRRLYIDRAEAIAEDARLDACESGAYAWRRLADHAPFGRMDGAGALSFRGRMYLLGGWRGTSRDSAHNEVWSSPDGKAWRFDGNAPWERRHTAGYAVFRDRMWIVGGDANAGHYQSDVWRSPDGVQWERTTDAAPWGPRVLHSVAAFQDRLWAIGGQTMPHFVGSKEPALHYSDVWSSADGRAWEKVSDGNLWAPRGGIGGSAVLDGKLYLLGGGTYDDPARPFRLYKNDVWATKDGIVWERIASNPPWQPRLYHSTTVWDDQIWVIAGITGATNLNDAWHSPDGMTWGRVECSPWGPRHASSVTSHNDRLILSGGPSTGIWSLTASPGRLSP